MVENKEITALFQLIDDPDKDVYTNVSDKIISFGKAIIPNLEDLWENTVNQDIQERIEGLIHKLHFRNLTEDFLLWRDGGCELLQGALLTAQYHYPEIQPLKTLQEIEKMRRNIWLELNSYLTPLEQINVLTSIVYNYYKQKGIELGYKQPEDFLINKAIETKKGNAISNGILYLILSELLDIPVRAINVPRQFILGYFDQQFDFMDPNKENKSKIIFYIDPLNGQIYSHKDVENYFKRINVPPVAPYFEKMDNKKIIQFLLEELSKCFDNDKNRYKMEELLQLANLLSE